MDKSRLHPPEKREILSSPSPKDVLGLPGKKALDAILGSPTPAHLVQSLAEEDLFWLVQDIGPEDSLPILSLASNDQWQYLLDLELWEMDRLSIGSVNRWLGLLLEADLQRFLIWGLREHIKLVEFHLYKNIDVRIKEEDESPSDFDEGFFSLDGVFYIRVRDERHDHTIREFLRRLAEHDIDRFHNVLLELAGHLPAEAEENMYRLRNARLAEKGFLPFEEAVGIYQYVSPKSLIKQEHEDQKIVQKPLSFQPVSVSTSLLMKEQDLFYMSLKQLENSHTLERLQVEFAGMCNQILSADGLVIRDKDDLAAVVGKACGYLDIGLENLGGKDPAKGVRLVEKYPLNQIFRVGYGAALELKWKTEKWLKHSWFATQVFSLSFWDDDWEGRLEGLLKKRPLFYTSLSDGVPYREFKALQEISHCHKALDQIINMDYLLSLLFPRAVPYPIQACHPLTYKNLILTCWARHHLALSQEIQPLLAEQLKAFFQDLLAKGEKPYHVKQEMRQSFLDYVVARSGLRAGEIEDRVGKNLDVLFSELETEYGSVSIEDLDPRYVRHFLVSS